MVINIMRGHMRIFFLRGDKNSTAGIPLLSCDATSGLEEVFIVSHNAGSVSWINNVNKDVLLCILKNLEPKDVLAFASVSKHHREIVRSNIYKLLNSDWTKVIAKRSKALEGELDIFIKGKALKWSRIIIVVTLLLSLSLLGGSVAGFVKDIAYMDSLSNPNSSEAGLLVAALFPLLIGGVCSCCCVAGLLDACTLSYADQNDTPGCLSFCGDEVFKSKVREKPLSCLGQNSELRQRIRDFLEILSKPKASAREIEQWSLSRVKEELTKLQELQLPNVPEDRSDRELQISVQDESENGRALGL